MLPGHGEVSAQFSGALLAVAGLLTEPRRATGPSYPQIIEKIHGEDIGRGCLAGETGSRRNSLGLKKIKY